MWRKEMGKVWIEKVRCQWENKRLYKKRLFKTKINWWKSTIDDVFVKDRATRSLKYNEISLRNIYDELFSDKLSDYDYDYFDVYHNELITKEKSEYEYKCFLGIIDDDA